MTRKCHDHQEGFALWQPSVFPASGTQLSLVSPLLEQVPCAAQKLSDFRLTLINSCPQTFWLKDFAFRFQIIFPVSLYLDARYEVGLAGIVTPLQQLGETKAWLNHLTRSEEPLRGSNDHSAMQSCLRAQFSDATHHN